jgi:D-xylose transport system substrate-binding protein
MKSSVMRLGCTAAAVVTAVALAGCGGSSSPSSSGTPSGGASSSSANTPQVSATSFTSDFSVMSQLTGLASQGKGKIGVLLPETTTSARYVDFDAPFLTKALETAGLKKGSDFTVTNAQGSTQTELTQAQAAITQGATVLIMDPIDFGTGASIEKYAHAHGVKVIDYDRISIGGSRDYYVSFDNVKVGELIGTGFVQCVTDWKVKKPNVLVMRGDPTDNNASLFAQGYNGVLKPKFSSGEYVKVGEPAGTWDPAKAATTFQQQYTAHKNINAVVMPNDANAAAVIAVLKNAGIPPKTFPTTGQDAQVSGLQNVLSGYQCGTVYKPIQLEAQAAAALALYLRAGQTPPSSLVNGKTNDYQEKQDVDSVLLTPIWVTPSNMKQVVSDGAVKFGQLCTGAYKSKCSAAGITG